MGINIELDSKDFVILFLILIGFIFLLQANVSFKTSIIFGDEGFHAGLSRWMAENREYPQWIPLGYTKVFKVNYARPPLFNILGAGVLFVFGQHEILLKLLPPLIGALIGIVFYLLVKKLYNREMGLISSLIFIGFPSFVTYTVLVFDEILFVFEMILFTFTFIIALKENSKKYWILSAVFGGMALLTKNAGMVIILFIPLAFLYLVFKEKRLSYYLKQFIGLSIIIFLITSLFFLRNFSYYNTPICYRIPFLPFDQSGCDIKNFVEERKFETRSLVGESENNIMRFGLLNFINFSYGNTWFILIGVIGGVLVFLIRKDERVNSLLLIMLVLGVLAVYGSFNRTEDTARQILFWSSLIALISATYWVEIYKFIQKYQKYAGLVVIVAIVFLSYQTITSKLEVMESVKRFSPSFFEACDWVKSNLSKDTIIMTFWGYRASYSCERTVSPGWADIRLNDNPEDIVRVAEMHGITHFFIQKFSMSQEPSRESYSIGFVQLLESNTDKFENVYENGSPLNQCIQQGGCDGNIIYKVVY